MSKIGVIGQGFVGSAVREGMKNYFTVITYDKDPNKESTASSIADVVKQVDETFLCVPTPMRKDGSCDLNIVRAALEEIATAVVKQQKQGFIVVIKSTIPPGTTEALQKGYPEFSIVFNPEFLTEANAVEDYKNQNRIILGGERYGTTKMKQVFEIGRAHV